MPWKMLRWWLLSAFWGSLALLVLVRVGWRQTPHFLVGMDVCLLMVMVERALLRRKGLRGDW